jgi:hypothetical protein
MHIGILRTHAFTLLGPAADHEPRHCHGCTRGGRRDGTRAKSPPIEACRDALQQRLFCAETPSIQGCATSEVTDDSVYHFAHPLGIACSALGGCTGMIERHNWNPALQADRHTLDRPLCEGAAPCDGHHPPAERYDAVAPAHSSDRHRMHAMPMVLHAQFGKLVEEYGCAAFGRIACRGTLRMRIVVHACRFGLRHGHADAYATGRRKTACTHDVLYAVSLMDHDDRQTDVQTWPQTWPQT